MSNESKAFIGLFILLMIAAAVCIPFIIDYWDKLE